jgi:dTDP-4-dehydrorhamnose reductase
LFLIIGCAPVSSFQFATLIFEAAGLDPVVLATNEREYRTAARRPKYSALSNEKMERAGLAPMPALREVLGSYFTARAAATTARK